MVWELSTILLLNINTSLRLMTSAKLDPVGFFYTYHSSIYVNNIKNTTCVHVHSQTLLKDWLSSNEILAYSFMGCIPGKPLDNQPVWSSPPLGKLTSEVRNLGSFKFTAFATATCNIFEGNGLGIEENFKVVHFGNGYILVGGRWVQQPNWWHGPTLVSGAYYPPTSHKTLVVTLLKSFRISKFEYFEKQMST